MTFIPYYDANSVGDRFLELLNQIGVNPPVATSLENELLSLTALIDAWKNPNATLSAAHHHAVLRTAAGVHDLAAKVLCAQGHSEAKGFIEHLKLIAAGKVYTSISQNAESDVRDDIARKITELYIGCLAIHCGTDIELDHPIAAKGDNPDVMLTRDGRRWALAIKTISSRSGQTIFENIKSAAGQIERSAADVGLVIINAKNVIDHDTFWNPTKPFGRLSEAVEAMTAQIRTIADLSTDKRPSSEWEELFVGKKASLPIIFMAQSVTTLPIGDNHAVPTPLKVMHAYGAGRAVDADRRAMAYCLNHWMQSLLKGQPGPPPS